jgi:hypothetical protein
MELDSTIDKDMCVFEIEKLNDDTVLFIKEKMNNMNERWLVTYATFSSESERTRFSNPNWIFWGQCKIEPSQYKITFIGDCDKLEHWEILNKFFPNMFEYITTDWEWGCIDDQLVDKYVYEIINLLAHDGITVLPHYTFNKNKWNVNNIFYSKENNYDYKFKICVTHKVHTPAGLICFGGGSNPLGDYIIYLYKYNKIYLLDELPEFKKSLVDSNIINNNVQFPLWTKFVEKYSCYLQLRFNSEYKEIKENFVAYTKINDKKTIDNWTHQLLELIINEWEKPTYSTEQQFDSNYKWFWIAQKINSNVHLL